MKACGGGGGGGGGVVIAAAASVRAKFCFNFLISVVKWCGKVVWVALFCPESVAL